MHYGSIQGPGCSMNNKKKSTLGKCCFKTHSYISSISFLLNQTTFHKYKKKKKMEQEENGVWEKMLVDMKKVT